MNEEIKNKILLLLEKTVDTGIDGIDKIEQEAPILFSEIVKYEIFMSSIYVFFSISIIILLSYFIKKILKQLSKEEYTTVNSEAKISVIILMIFIIIGSTIVFFYQIDSLIKFYISPRIAVLEYLKNLVKY